MTRGQYREALAHLHRAQRVVDRLKSQADAERDRRVLNQVLFHLAQAETVIEEVQPIP